MFLSVKFLKILCENTSFPKVIHRFKKLYSIRILKTISVPYVFEIFSRTCDGLQCQNEKHLLKVWIFKNKFKNAVKVNKIMNLSKNKQKNIEIKPKDWKK